MASRRAACLDLAKAPARVSCPYVEREAALVAGRGALPVAELGEGAPSGVPVCGVHPPPPHAGHDVRRPDHHALECSVFSSAGCLAVRERCKAQANEGLFDPGRCLDDGGGRRFGFA